MNTHTLPTPLGPYDDIPISQKQRITTFISTDDYNYLFKTLFPQFGMQTRVTAALIARFVTILQKHVEANPTIHPISIFEQLVNNLTSTYKNPNETIKALID